MSRVGPINVPDTLGDLATLSLPAGKYLVYSSLALENRLQNTGDVECRLAAGATTDAVRARVPGPLNHQSISLSVAVQLDEATDVVLRCVDGDRGLLANGIDLSAIAVRNLSVSVLTTPLTAPDLLVELQGTYMTVKNLGNAAAGPFTVHTEVPAQSVTANYRFSEGMPGGGSYVLAYNCHSGAARTARVDSLDEVDESDESNNDATLLSC